MSKKLALPTYCNPEYVQCVLDGDLHQIILAFSWDETPQGVAHWDAIYRGRSKLTIGDRSYLKRMLRECQEGA